MNEEPHFQSPLGLIRWIGWAQRKAGEDWVRERDLSHEQAFVLGILAQQPGMIQRDIAEMTRTTPASVSSLLQGLERRGLIERRADANNARTKLVYATDEGAALTAGFDDLIVGLEDQLLAPLDAGERTELQRLLSKITAELPEPTRD
jgi:MarR family transcriptional regulator, repressor for mepA